MMPPNPNPSTKRRKSRTNPRSSKIKKYDDVITKDAVTKTGLFRVHRVDDTLFYEIPPDALDTDLLWVVQISETTAGNSYAGMPVGDRVVRWELHGDQVLLRDVRYDIRADTTDPIAQAVKASNLAPIIRAFDVKAYGKDKAPVIDVTDLFKKDVAEFSAPERLAAPARWTARAPSSRSSRPSPGTSTCGSWPASPRENRAAAPDDSPPSSGVTAVICHSMVKLPETPMKPRRFDSRVGFFTESFTDYSDHDEHEAETVRYILRWRLEKKNPEAKVSEPVKPIVFYVAREVPEKWKSYVKAGH